PGRGPLSVHSANATCSRTSRDTTPPISEKLLSPANDSVRHAHREGPCVRSAGKQAIQGEFRWPSSSLSIAALAFLSPWPIQVRHFSMSLCISSGDILLKASREITPKHIQRLDFPLSRNPRLLSRTNRRRAGGEVDPCPRGPVVSGLRRPTVPPCHDQVPSQP